MLVDYPKEPTQEQKDEEPKQENKDKDETGENPMPGVSQVVGKVLLSDLRND